MKLFWLLFAIALLSVSLADGKRKRKFDGDFEFAEEEESRVAPPKIADKKRWIHDPSSDLCRPLNCKKKELCLLEDAFTAVCVSKKDLHKNRDEVITKAKLLAEEEARRKAQALALAEQDEAEDDDDVFYDTEDDPEEQEDVSEAITCKPCPVVTPTFLCGADNRTYSSLCRLDYHNCIHQTAIKVACKGFCPCKDTTDAHLRKKQRQAERISNFMTKYKNTIDKDARAKKTAQYTFTPEDFKFENKHYKYIKYTKYNKDNNMIFSEDKDRQRGYNEATLDLKTSRNQISTNGNSNPNGNNGVVCSASALQSMGNRLLDWFSVVMADSKKRRTHNKSKARFPSGCKSEAKWMFGHLDLDGDSVLSVQELYDLEHDRSERCIRPFLERCSGDGGNVNPSEWCRCFERADRPCAAVKRRAVAEMLGAYSPDCDEQGFYKSTQCHSSVGLCWCVDKHGVEFANTRTRGKPDCERKTDSTESVLNKASSSSAPVVDESLNEDDDEDDGDDSENSEGSADQPLDF
uniref:Putative proteoglycan cow n=1 Tax=Xenopsylla cheopis TaxID=163159 RepID=A0A6M2E0B4_XENCH